MHPISARLSFARRYVDRHVEALLAGLVALLARDGIGAAIPLLIRQAVTLLMEGRTSQAAWMALAMFAAAIPKAGLQTFARLRMMNVSRDVEYEMRNDLFRHLLTLEAGFYSRMRTGDVMAHATNDLNSVRMMMGPGVVNFSESLVMFPVAFAVTVPAQALAGRLTWQVLAGAWVFAAALFTAARVLWKAGLRRYQGASA